VTAGHDVALEQTLHNLRDELPEVRMEAVDVLRPLALRELGFGPREHQSVVGELAVEGSLRRCHGPRFDAEPLSPRRS
jgi:hypothetical protein